MPIWIDSNCLVTKLLIGMIEKQLLCFCFYFSSIRPINLSLITSYSPDLSTALARVLETSTHFYHKIIWFNCIVYIGKDIRCKLCTSIVHDRERECWGTSHLGISTRYHIIWNKSHLPTCFFLLPTTAESHVPHHLFSCQFYPLIIHLHQISSPSSSI